MKLIKKVSLAVIALTSFNSMANLDTQTVERLCNASTNGHVEFMMIDQENIDDLELNVSITYNCLENEFIAQSVALNDSGSPVVSDISQSNLILDDITKQIVIKFQNVSLSKISANYSYTPVLTRNLTVTIESNSLEITNHIGELRGKAKVTVVKNDNSVLRKVVNTYILTHILEPSENLVYREGYFDLTESSVAIDSFYKNFVNVLR